MPYLSLVMPTMRVGGLDITFEGLKNQTFKDFELIIADGLYSFRKEIVAEKAREYGFQVKHIEPIDNPFPLNCFCRYANSGLAHASGEVVLFCVDYTYFPADCLQRHADFHKSHSETTGFMSPHQYVMLPELDPRFPKYQECSTGLDAERYYNDVISHSLDPLMWSILAKPFAQDPKDLAPDPVWGNADLKLIKPLGPVDHMIFHGKNESCKLKPVLEVNGWDEGLDGTHGWQDTDLADRMHIRLGVHWEIDPTNVAWIINPRHVFPLARRNRNHMTNNAVWSKRKAQGYSKLPNTWNLNEVRSKNLGQ